jgi:hypothetical protein
MIDKQYSIFLTKNFKNNLREVVTDCIKQLFYLKDTNISSRCKYAFEIFFPKFCFPYNETGELIQNFTKFDIVFVTSEGFVVAQSCS